MLAFAVLWAPLVRADAQSQLDLAETRYKNGKYEEAVDILSKLLAVRVDPTTEEGKERRAVYIRARPIYVACLIGLDRTADAREVALEQYRDEPYYEPPVGQFAQPVIDLFIEVEAENRDLIEDLKSKVIEDKQERARLQVERAKAQAERLRRLEELASEETVTTSRSRWIAAIPFGVGQFQNGSTALGVLFATSETLALTSTLLSAGIAFDAQNEQNGPPTRIDDDGNQVTVDGAALEARFDTAQVANWVSLGALGALVVAGIIEAQVNFAGDDVEKKKRPLPPRVEPDVVVSEQGAYLGIRGRF